MKCRHCGDTVRLPFADLGLAPPSNAFVAATDLGAPERRFPLRVLVCETCWLAQTEDFADAGALFDADYVYFSGFSQSWLAHAELYVARMIERFGLDAASHVVEVAANDGYLLQFVQRAGLPCLGVEPTHSTAQAARARGIPIVEAFFGEAEARRLVAEGHSADLCVANNVLAHVPDINDFARGFAVLLKPEGVATFEFPHLIELIAGRQFDTIYHEHFSYLSLAAVEAIFTGAGLRVFDVERLDTHGGSLRVFAERVDSPRPRSAAPGLAAVRALEAEMGVRSPALYAGFQPQVDRIRDDFIAFLEGARAGGKVVAAYGAAAKGNTLMNYAGIRKGEVAFVVDRNPAKQGKFLPGSHIPVVDEAHLRATRPDYVLILPWNLWTEITEQLSYVREWGGQFVIAVPELRVS